MDKNDLMQSISEIDEELLERSERNKQKASDMGKNKVKKKKANSRLTLRIAASAAAVLFITGLTVLILYFRSNNDNKAGDKNEFHTDAVSEDKAESYTNTVSEGKDESGIFKMKTYTVSAAEYPELMKKPDYFDFDEGNDGSMGPEEMDAYFAAQKEWAEQNSAFKNVEGYDTVKGKAGILDFNSKAMQLFLVEHNHENRIYSPINIYIALGMLAETTEGNTRKQILDLLGLNDIEALRVQIKGLWNGAYSDDKLKSVLASSVWLRDDIKYKKDTLDSLARNYYTSSFAGDMGDEEYSQAFRNWLNDQTDDLLMEQIGELQFTQDTVMALATTVSFSARWSNEFNKSNTQTDVFHSANGDIQCDYMNKYETGQYFYGDRFGAITRLFDGAQGNMMFILPDEGVSVYDLLEDKQVMSFIDKGSYYEKSKFLIINMSIPRFDVSSNQSVNDALKKLGITDAFDPEQADFSPVSDETGKIWLGKVEHGVRVITDEEGVKAAAYTTELLCGAAEPPEEKIDFVLDRPFVFVINYGGIPMFVGIVEKP